MKNKKLKVFLIYTLIGFPISILIISYLTNMNNTELWYYYWGLCIGVGLGIFNSKEKNHEDINR